MIFLVVKKKRGCVIIPGDLLPTDAKIRHSLEGLALVFMRPAGTTTTHNSGACLWPAIHCIYIYTTVSLHQHKSNPQAYRDSTVRTVRTRRLQCTCTDVVQVPTNIQNCFYGRVNFSLWEGLKIKIVIWLIFSKPIEALSFRKVKVSNKMLCGGQYCGFKTRRLAK